MRARGAPGVTPRRVRPDGLSPEGCAERRYLPRPRNDMPRACENACLVLSSLPSSLSVFCFSCSILPPSATCHATNSHATKPHAMSLFSHVPALSNHHVQSHVHAHKCPQSTAACCCCLLTMPCLCMQMPSMPACLSHAHRLSHV